MGDNNLATCPETDFPINMKGVQCDGLSQVTTAQNESDCRNACCESPNCATYQWCPSNGQHCSPLGSCWIGAINNCHNGIGWQSMGY